jgi:hypothetical protein
MIRLLFLSILSLFLTDNPGDKDRFEPIEKTFSINWKAKIGNVSFRSNVLFSGDELIIGSNGKNFRDYYLGDETSGVYKLNRQTGKINALYGNDRVIGDLDVNGILMYNNKYYFGNDNDEFMCLNASGKNVWTIMTSGDIEHEPVLIHINGKPAVVYASEIGEVRAVNPDNGNTYWSYYIPDFKGWKPGDNRAVFKVRSFVRNTMSFYTKPVIADLNKDGIKDLVYKEIYGSTFAIDGRNGKLLWSISTEQNRTSFDVMELLPKPDGEWMMIGCRGEYLFESEDYRLHVFLISRTGELKEIFTFDNKIGACGLNMTTNGDNEILFTTTNKLYRLKNLKDIEVIDRSIQYVSEESWNKGQITNRNSYDPLMSTNTFPYKNHNNCIFVLNQYDDANDLYGFIEIISLDENKVIERLELPGNSEMVPLVYDVNKDGMLDLLINSKVNGYLYCYNLNIPASSISDK